MRPWTPASLILLLIIYQTDPIACRSDGYIYSASIKELAEVPVMPHQLGGVDPSPVQGLHVALAGSQDLRITWMTPSDWGSGPFSPLCVYRATGLMPHKVRGRPYSYTAGQGQRDYNSFPADKVQMFLHVGDITYADCFDTKSLNNSWVWVQYMNSLQRVAATVPYMTAPGNHEAQFEFAAYLNWLPMPHRASCSDSPFWYSFDYLGMHLLFFSTEHDFSPNSTQHRWMQRDLKAANKNRAQVPWVVVLGHRPLYCSSLFGYDRCHEEGALYRTYLEDLFYEFRVDVVIAGHIHHYERSYPVYKGNVTQRHYNNPQAPVYIVNGGAGNPEPNDPTFEPNVDWRAWYESSAKTGFLLMTPSRFQLRFEYVLSDVNHVVDSFTVTKK